MPFRSGGRVFAIDFPLIPIGWWLYGVCFLRWARLVYSRNGLCPLVVFDRGRPHCLFPIRDLVTSTCSCLLRRIPRARKSRDFRLFVGATFLLFWTVPFFRPALLSPGLKDCIGPFIFNLPKTARLPPPRRSFLPSRLMSGYPTWRSSLFRKSQRSSHLYTLLTALC